MLIHQPRLGTKVCNLWKQTGQMYWSPLPVPTAHDIERYVPYRERWDYYELGRNFASRLASMTAQLGYDGLRLYASLWGSYSEGDDYWFDGPVTEDHAFVIRTAADYDEMYGYYLEDGDDWDWSYQIVFAIAPATLIK